MTTCPERCCVRDPGTAVCAAGPQGNRRWHPVWAPRAVTSSGRGGILVDSTAKLIASAASRDVWQCGAAGVARPRSVETSPTLLHDHA